MTNKAGKSTRRDKVTKLLKWRCGQDDSVINRGLVNIEESLGKADGRKHMRDRQAVIGARTKFLNQPFAGGDLSS
jgi:hypothetical protein